MNFRHFASRALPLAFTALLIAAGTVSAGDYSPKHLRAETFLRLETTSFQSNWGEPYRGRDLPFTLPTEFAFAQPLSLRSSQLLLRLEAKPKLRRIVQLELRF